MSCPEQVHVQVYCHIAITAGMKVCEIQERKVPTIQFRYDE